MVLLLRNPEIFWLYMTSEDEFNIQQLEKAQGKAVLMNAQTGFVLTVYNLK